MMKRSNILFVIIILLAGFACQNSTRNATGEGHLGGVAFNPGWLNDAVLYEVNIRQYTPEGTFNAFAEHLPRLKDLGVDILWIMPIHPISVEKRKGTLGSYYAVADYLKVNPEFGSLEDFKSLVDQSHEMGFHVIIDWVANHTGWDNPWITEHPEWYTTDSLGSIISPDPGWTDVADLNFDQKPMREAMINAMDYWLEETDIDGFRCDVAWGVPVDFWEDARASFDSIKPVYMLAEDEEHTAFLNKAFNSNYAWKLHHIMNSVAQKNENVEALSSYFVDVKNKYPNGSFPMQFITNHDENSWSGTIHERMGDAANTFAVFSFTVPGIPLIYSGQEAGLNKRLEFFEKDEIDWSNLELQAFYKKLIQLKKNNGALWNGDFGGSMKIMQSSVPDQLFAYTREKDSSRVIVVFNLSPEPVKGIVHFPEEMEVTDYFGGNTFVCSKDQEFELSAWGYRVLVN